MILNYAIRNLIIHNIMYFIFDGSNNIFFILFVNMGQMVIRVITTINIVKQLIFTKKVNGRGMFDNYF